MNASHRTLSAQQGIPGGPVRPARNGWTLIEMLVVLAVVGLLGSLATSTMAAIRESARLGALANDVFGTLRLARSEAIKRNTRVTACKSASGMDCAGEGAWHQGWIVFEDRDADGLVDPDEAVIQRVTAMVDGFRLSGNSMVGSYVSYTPTGRTRTLSGAFQAGTLTLCRASAEPVQARALVINHAGRVRVERRQLASCG